MTNHPFIDYILQRVTTKNKNFVMAFVGSTGSGKSWAALKVASELDPDFKIEHCCFRAKEFMKLINNFNKQEHVKPGTVILWDEAGVELSAREFMTLSNRVINYFFQTCRHLNLIILMTVPLLGFIDSTSRKLLHCVAETSGINSHDQTTLLKVKMIQTNSTTGEVYQKYLRYSEDGKGFVLRTLAVPKPDKELLKYYEKKKLNFTADLNQRIENQLERIEEKDKKKEIIRKPLTDRQQKIYDYSKQGMRTCDIAKKLGMKEPHVSTNMKWIRNKGYKLGNMPRE